MSVNDIEVLSLDGLLGVRLERLWDGNLRVLAWEDDFLAPFREEHPAGTYVGLGKTLSGLNGVARLRGGEAAELRTRLVQSLVEAQKPDGYLGLYRPEDRTYRVWDVHEQAYLIQALVEAGEWFADETAQQVALRLGDWLLPRLEDGRWRSVGSDGLRWIPLPTLGIDRAMLHLHRATGDQRYLDFVREDMGIPDWFDPIVEGRQGAVEGHAYAYLARALAQLELLGEGEPLPRATRAALGYLVAGGGLVITGTAGQEECWHSDQQLDGLLGETCTTAYLIRWAAHLLGRTGESFYADLMERAMYNALFAANDTDGRRIHYYTVAQGERTWFERDTYCCPGNYRRIMGELPFHVVRSLPEGLSIDLYEAGTFRVARTARRPSLRRARLCPGRSAPHSGAATGEAQDCSHRVVRDAADCAPCNGAATGENGMQVQVQIGTGYPWSGNVTVTVEPETPATFDLQLRVPGWSAGVSLTVNGIPAPPDVHRGWLRIERHWEHGDRVDLRLDMPWRLVRGFRRQRGRAALMHGPIVWGARPADNPEAGEELAEAVLDPGRAGNTSDPRACTTTGALPDGRDIALRLVPFLDPDVTVTYFRQDGTQADERDHLLDVEVAPVGTPAAPG